MALDMTGINAQAYNDYYLREATNGASGTDLKEKLEGTGKSATDEELMDACKQFEAYFLEQVFKEMQKSVDTLREANGVDKTSNNLVNYFKGTTMTKMCEDATENQGLGLAQMLFENMKRTYGSAVVDAEEVIAAQEAALADAMNGGGSGETN